jgi:uncharacterized protein with NAD-binding domain and iron-sulfur cluster
MAEPQKKRIAILGGGMGALASAYYLTSQPGWQDRYSVDIHTLGWRLGGKCASSRGIHGRIEEHGIHGFLGSYYNAIPMVKAIYDELDRPKTSPIATYDQAMVPMSDVIMWEWIDGALRKWPFSFPPNDMDPTCPEEFFKIERGIISVLELMKKIYHQHHDEARKHGVKLGLLDTLFDKAIDALESNLAHGTDHPVFDVFDTLWVWIEKSLHDMVEDSTALRHLFLLTDYLLALVRGAIRGNVIEQGYDHLDDEDWGQWLRDNGAAPSTVASSLAINTINLSYQNPHGDTTRIPRMGAGTYLHWSLRSFAYLGYAVYAFAAGTGETMIAPLYEVLERRGVNFHFFHKVTGLHLGPDPKSPGKKIVTSVDIDVQATVKAEPYRPLFPQQVLGDQWLPCWPADPLYDQLEQGEILKAGIIDFDPGERGDPDHPVDIDLESWWTPWKPVGQMTLTAGSDGPDSYDELIFAISIGAVPYLCKELVASNLAWQTMIDGIPAVLTQTMQIWLKESYTALGWNVPYAGNNTVVSGTFVVPINGTVEFRHLIPMEDWPADALPKSLWYFSGVMDEYSPEPPFTDHDYPRRQHARVRYQCIQYLQATTGLLMPGATVDGHSPPGDPLCLDFNLLVDTRPGAMGEGDDFTIRGIPRFESQFWRANIDPTERYVTSPPGSTKCRLKAWGSGFANLTLAGDWIYTGLNVGSFEGTVMSGKLASYAITGYPAIDTIYGYNAREAKLAG